VAHQGRHDARRPSKYALHRLARGGEELAHGADEVDGATARGLHQVATGRRGEGHRPEGGPAITLDLTMAMDAPRPRDVVTIEGDPPISMTVAGGIHGDVATWALAVNALPRVLAAPPGLATVHRLPPIHG
jgi:4-hydroxy-tetrahydrodipicolinate reductase